MTLDDPPIPPPPRFALDTELDPSSEVDVDLSDDENGPHRRPLPEDAEYLGTFESIEAYMRSQLEPEVPTGVRWILDCLDWREVQRRFESDGSRLLLENGHVYRAED